MAAAVVDSASFATDSGQFVVDSITLAAALAIAVATRRCAFGLASAALVSLCQP